MQGSEWKELPVGHTKLGKYPKFVTHKSIPHKYEDFKSRF